LVTECVESALVELYAEMGGPASGAALAAVGSLARQELGPRSDIDLVLLHDGWLMTCGIHSGTRGSGLIMRYARRRSVPRSPAVS
jgi:glutamine synthetase adenylyltransferase